MNKGLELVHLFVHDEILRTQSSIRVLEQTAGYDLSSYGTINDKVAVIDALQRVLQYIQALDHQEEQLGGE